MSEATLVLHRKYHFDDGAIIEMKLWQVPTSVRGSVHNFKYSLYYGKNGKRLVAYDNEAGKGDHCHYGTKQVAYRFTTPEKLMADFMADVTARRRKIT